MIENESRVALGACNHPKGENAIEKRRDRPVLRGLPKCWRRNASDADTQSPAPAGWRLRADRRFLRRLGLRLPCYLYFRGFRIPAGSVGVDNFRLGTPGILSKVDEGRQSRWCCSWWNRSIRGYHLFLLFTEAISQALNCNKLRAWPRWLLATA